jgi:hypothetical protein
VSSKGQGSARENDSQLICSAEQKFKSKTTPQEKLVSAINA